MPVIEKKRRRSSERGNWLVVTYMNGEIWWCKWVQTWAGVQASKRHAERERDPRFKTRVIILDIERMVDFAATEGANEIADLHKLFERS